MFPIVYIRKHILKMTQQQLANVAGVHQPDVSHWEKGTREPSRDEMQRIRSYAVERGLPWNDSWFFEVPKAPMSA